VHFDSVTICDCACASAQELQCLQLQSNRVSINAFVKSHFVIARVAGDCRVQSLRRPDAAEKGNNVALILVHGVFEGSVAIAASERVTMIQ
jgi:hypothetical protein